jgi:hypothetical protein
VKDLTPIGAKRKRNHAHKEWAAAQQELAEIKRRRGWAALGYPSFEAFLKAEIEEKLQ